MDETSREVSLTGHSASITSISQSGLILNRAIHAYAQAHKSDQSQVYQVEGLFILHTGEGATDDVSHPTTDDSQPIPITLAVLAAEDNSNFQAKLRTYFAADTVQVWRINSSAKSITVYHPHSDPVTYQVGHRLPGGTALPGFSIEIATLFSQRISSGKEVVDTTPFSQMDQSILRALIYPVQFERQPVDGVDRVVSHVGKNGILKEYSPAEVAAAIKRGLSSDAALADLLPQSHPEDAIRAFLSELSGRLQDENS